jgi:hypothetical protein
LATLKTNLATLKRVATPSLRTAAIGHEEFLFSEVAVTTDDEKAILLNPDLTKLELSGDESKDIAVVCGWFASRLVLVKLEMSQ